MECVICVCVRLGAGGVGGERIRFWALPILEEHGESGICVCVLVAVVLGGEGSWVGSLGQGLGGWCVVMYVCVSCESVLFGLMTSPGIVLGGYLHILDAPSVKSLLISAS